MKHDPNEMLILDLSYDDKIDLHKHIKEQMAKFGYNPSSYRSLGLGFRLPPNWPVDKDHPPTLTQITVLAKKLRFKIIITGLSVEPLRDGTG